MKNITRKIIAVFAVLCVAMTSFAGCSDGSKENSSGSSSSSSSSNDGSSESSAAEVQMQYPLSIGKAGDDNDLALDDPSVDLEGDDPVNSSESSKSGESSGSSESKAPAAEKATEVQDVTDAKGEPVTQVVEVTKANGEKEVDDKGEPVTETVKVTEIVTKPTEAGSEKTTEGGNSGTSNYTPKSDGRYAMWLDVSKNEDFFFEGPMLKATFKVKEGIPDGDYKIRISPDLSDVKAVAIYPSKVIDGIIRVNKGEIEAVDVSNESGMIFYGDNVSCKQGDTIDFNINIKNNTGLAAFCIWFYFDSNALEFVDAGATGEFEEVAYDTEIGNGNKSE